MTKFKVGDKVIFNNEHASAAKECGYKINKAYEVQEVFEHYKTLRITNEDGITHCFNYERFELVEPKLTKNQRITALENEVAELKLIVHELRDGRKTMRDVMNEVLSEHSTINTVEDIIEFEGQQYRKVDREAYEGDVVICHSKTLRFVEKGKPYKVTRYDGFLTLNAGTPKIVNLYNRIRTPENVDVYELIKEGLNPQIPMVDETIEPLTPNQQRAAIIEKAKKFVEDLKDEEGKYSKSTVFGNSELIFEFVVNPEKRTVVALGRLFYYPSILKVYAKGIAKCAPNDVFNEHIGKAIALGRALGLDVSEFEHAVQPNKVVLGHIIVWNKTPNKQYKVLAKNGDCFDFIYLKDNKRYNNRGYREIERFTKILNDTNAIY